MTVQLIPLRFAEELGHHYTSTGTQPAGQMFQLQAEDEHKLNRNTSPQNAALELIPLNMIKKALASWNNRRMGTGRGVWGDRRCGQISMRLPDAGGFGEVGKPNGYYIFFRARRSTRHNSLYISSLVRL